MTMTPLIEQIRKQKLFPHPVKYFKVKETHTSWIILTGEFAYKIKKPVDFQFLNYSTLELRKRYCDRELQFNRATAASIYLKVIPLTGSLEHLEWNGNGTVIEYAIQMREFPQAALFDHLLRDHRLTLNQCLLLAQQVAYFHQQADEYSGKEHGDAAQVQAPVLQNFEQIRGLFSLAEKKLSTNQIQLLQQSSPLLDVHEAWAQQFFQTHHFQLQQRKIHGFIKACHGDLHLGNLINYQRTPTLFDCIEFNDDLRIIDVYADIGFLMMDFIRHQRPDLAYYVLNHYLEITGDYKDLELLRYYQAYRAMVRSKVALFEVAHNDLEPKALGQKLSNYLQYLQLAAQLTQTHKPYLILMMGVSGSGKSRLSEELIKQLPFIRLRSDVERKRLFGLNIYDKAPQDKLEQLYSPKAHEQTFQKLVQLSETLLKTNYPVIVDAAFLKRTVREQFITLAQKHKIPIRIIYTNPPLEFIKKNIEAKRFDVHDPSDADYQVVLDQMVTQDPLEESELKHTLEVDTSQYVDSPDKLIEQVIEFIQPRKKSTVQA